MIILLPVFGGLLLLALLVGAVVAVCEISFMQDNVHVAEISDF